MRSSPLTSTPLRRRLLAGIVLAPLALAIAGCAKAPSAATDPTLTGAIANPISQQDFEKAAAYWSNRYDKKPDNRDAALNYAAALQRTGQTGSALIILQKAVASFPEDKTVLAALGKAQAASGDLDQALETIQRAETPASPDAKLMSAEAAILDQLGRKDDARKLYADALKLSPKDPSILSNYAMSYVMTGDLKQAELLLRQAIAAPGADSRVRQNLALVVGLQGRFDEAERIAGAELSPDQAAANIAYLKQMLTQQNSWESLKTGKAAT